MNNMSIAYPTEVVTYHVLQIEINDILFEQKVLLMTCLAPKKYFFHQQRSNLKKPAKMKKTPSFSMFFYASTNQLMDFK